MKQTTRLHGFFHPMIMFHIMGWKNPCALVQSEQKLMQWMLGIVLVAVVIPLIKDLIL
jgi:hypothetical protein